MYFCAGYKNTSTKGSKCKRLSKSSAVLKKWNYVKFHKCSKDLNFIEELFIKFEPRCLIKGRLNQEQIPETFLFLILV